MGTSGISTGFPVLSQTSGQVAHVLLTRSPLGLHQCCHWMDLVRLACVKHAASVRPEPGSNSPSRSRAPKSPLIRESRLPGQLPHPPLWHQDGHCCCPCTPRNIVPRRLSALTVATTEVVARTGFWLPLFRFQGANRPTDTPLQKGDVRVAPMSPGLAWSGASMLQVAVRAAVQPTRARPTCQGRPRRGHVEQPGHDSTPP
jgi:hypothetical protein